MVLQPERGSTPAVPFLYLCRPFRGLSLSESQLMYSGGLRIPMFALARLLICERLRRLGRHYGWACYASLMLMLVVFMCASGAAATRYVRQSTTADLGQFLSMLWAAWVITAIALGKDLSWQIRPERILVFPVAGFLRLYMLAFLLGFLSIPLLVFLLVLAFWSFLKIGFALGALTATLIGGCLYIASVRLTVSLARVVMLPGRHCPTLLRLAGGLFSILLLVCTWASIPKTLIGILLPGHELSLVLSGEHFYNPLICMVALLGLLAAMDFALQRSLTYSGIQGPLSPGSRALSPGRLLLPGSSWPGPLVRIAILGWLRSRNALLLFIWGMAYGFFYMYFMKPDEAFDFCLFIWLNQLFHAYLRGNLLGIDRGAVWLYHMFPTRIERALSSKSLALHLFQGSMIAAVLLGGFLRAGPLIDLLEWVRILSYATSSVLAGEICGFYFSVRYPDPIDRASQFSGGTAAGALLVPIVQLLYLGFFLLSSGLARRFMSPAVYASLLLAAPASLLVLRRAVLRLWVHKTMLDQRETIWKKLSVVPL